MSDWRDAVYIFLTLLIITLCLGAFGFVGWWVISVVKAG